MQYIPLTCGGCQKRYRLPLTANGFFRCRSCDLVMPIPDSGSVVLEPPDDDEEIAEIGFDPETNEPIHLQTTAEETEAEPTTPDNVYGQHLKKSTSVNPADLALAFVGAGMLASGLFVLWLQLSKAIPEDRSILAARLGLAVAIIGAVAFGFGTRSRWKIGLPASLLGGLAAAGVFGFILFPSEPETDDNQLAKRESTPIEAVEAPSSRFSLEDIRKRNEEASRRKTARGKARNERPKSRSPIARIKGGRVVSNKSASNGTSQSSSKSTSRSGNPKTEEPDEQNPELDTELNTLDRNLKEIRQRQSEIPLAGDAEKISKLWEKTKVRSRLKDAEKIRGLIRSSTNDSAIDERTVEYLEMVERRLTNLEKFSKGEWVNIDFKYGADDWLTSQDNVVNFQSESTASVNTLPAAERTIIASPDAFFGAVTLDLEVQLESPGKFGFFFTDDRKVSQIDPDDYVMMFDGASGGASFGLFESLEQDAVQVNVEQSLGQISWGQPVPIRITNGFGYLQVFVKNKLVLEHFDSRIRTGTRLAIANLGKANSHSVVTIQNCKVKSLKGGTPPGKSEFAEADIMYFNDVIGDFDDFGYAYYRLALARFGLGRIKDAVASANEAKRLGFPEHRLAVILALEKELAKQDGDACDQYLKSKPDERPAIGGVQDRTKWQIDLHPIAQAYHAWLVVTNPDSSIRSRGTVSRLPANFHPLPWVAARIEAALEAKDGNYAQAVSTLSKIKDDVPVHFKGQFNKQLEAYKEKTPFLREPGRMPFYHDVRMRVEPKEVTYAK